MPSRSGTLAKAFRLPRLRPTTRSVIAGNPVAPNTLAEDTFFVAADANNNNEPTLFCYTSNDATRGNVPLVAGVESMQLLYGDDIDNDGILNRYIRGGIGNVSAPNNVRSVKLSIVARTPGASAVHRSAQQIDHFGIDYSGVVAQGTDKRVFTTPADGDPAAHQHHHRPAQPLPSLTRKFSI